MAAAYIDEIRARQPVGPYSLAGYSFGGLIALEMACRLREAGDEVDLLALFETEIHHRNLPLAEWLAYLWSPVGRVAHKLNVLPLRHWPAYLRSKAAKSWHRVLLRLELIEPSDQEARETVLARNRDMYKLGAREFVAYRARRFAGEITVFRTGEPSLEACDPLPVWRRVADSVEVFTIAGTHGTIMEARNVDTLASQLSICLARTVSHVPAMQDFPEPFDACHGAVAVPAD
jgi:acetoacetyl-CoA synthetase